MRFRSHSLVTYVATSFSQRVSLFLLSIIFERARGTLRGEGNTGKDSIAWTDKLSISIHPRYNKRSSRFSISLRNFLRIDPLSSSSKHGVHRSLTINERSRDDTRNWISINGITNDTKIEIVSRTASKVYLRSPSVFFFRLLLQEMKWN